ncbi:MAG TPA: tetratricopeptide repeat protein [Candidatus Acidoferrum sp.]|nr:tetratricopeptide repeat protein [Candidatus Acidoferrum sp.]
MRSDPSPSAPSWDRARLVSLGLALITLLVYLPVFFHDFIVLDDPLYISANPMVQAGLTWAGVKWAFIGFHQANWHPLTWLSHMLDVQLFGSSPGPLLLVNVLFHAASAVLLFRIWWRITAQFWPAAFIAAVFAWHPMRVESVAWASERKDVLCMLLSLLALWFYLGLVERKAKTQSGALRHYGLAVGFFALGLMAKAMWVTFPFVLLLLDYWPLQRWSQAQQTGGPPATGVELLRLVLEKWPFFLLAGLSCVVTFLAQSGSYAVVTLGLVPPGVRLSNAITSYAQYLRQMFWPADLAAFYPLPMSISLWRPVVVAAALLALSGLAWGMRRRKPYLFVGWFWFLGTLVPMIGLAQAGIQGRADRYTYLPSIGIAVACAFALRDLVARYHVPATVTGAASVVVLASSILVTEHQLRFWRNTETLMVRTLAVTRDNFMAHSLLGTYYNHEGRTREALTEFREALRIQKEAVARIPALVQQSLPVHLLLGAAFEREGNLDEALEQYQDALQIAPASPQAHNSLGNLLLTMNRPREAEAQYRAAIRLAPGDPVALCGLAHVLIQTGHFEDGARQYEEAARLNPADPAPDCSLGKALLRRGQSAQAISHFREALRRDPANIQSLTFLARVLSSDPLEAVRNGAEALRLAQKVNTLTENREPFVLDTLAMAYAESGSFSQAQDTLQRAIEIAHASGHDQDVAEMQDRLTLYSAGRPFRQTSPPPAVPK